MSRMFIFAQLSRLLIIIWVCCRFRLDAFIPGQALPFWLRLFVFFGPWKLFPTPKQSREERLRLALECLGPIFVKFGQILSTRRDLLSDELANQLKQLQDKVAPFDAKLSKQLIENSLSCSLDEAFSRFDDIPMASASIAQVHSAALHNGKEVVVKVTRPNIVKTIRQDVSLMRLIANGIETYWSEGYRLHPVQVVNDYEKVIFDELDMQREAANASQLRRNFLDSDLIYIPEIFWQYISRDVLVMERVYGMPVADLEALHAANVDLKTLAERGVEIFFTQVFRDSFFHADMHPGNIFVAQGKPALNPQYIAIDFGIVGALSVEDQNYLARNLLAFFQRDYRQVAQLHVSSGWVPADTQIEEFEAAIRTVCEPIFERPLKEISFGHFLLRLFQTARRFNMEVQPQLVLLQKTLLNIEGLGRQLYPDLDLWQTAQPYLENWLKQKLAPPGILKSLKQQLPDLIEHSPEIPSLVFDAMTQIKHLDKHGQQRETEIRALRLALDQQKRGRHQLVGGIGLLLAGAIASQPEILVWLQSLSYVSIGLIALGGWFVLKR